MTADSFMADAVAVLSRGHDLFAGREAGSDVGDAPAQVSARADGLSADGLPASAAARSRASVAGLRRLASTDGQLGQIVQAACDDRAHARLATRVILDAALADRMPGADTPMGRREAIARMVARLRAQHGHIKLSRSQARVLAARLRRLQYLRGQQHRGHDGAGESLPAALGQLTRNSSRRQVAAAIIAEAHRRGYSPRQTVAILSTAMRESDLNPRAVSPNGLWRDIFQQDNSYPGRDNPNLAVSEFFNRLDHKGGSASPDIWKSIFWLQQAPGAPSAESAYLHGREAYMSEIKSCYGSALQMYNEITTNSTSRYV